MPPWLIAILASFAEQAFNISAGQYHTCAVRSGDSTIVCWGDNEEGQLAAPSGTFIEFSAGNNHSCGLRTDATIACWGRNSWGETTPPAGVFSSVSAGDAYSCAIDAKGREICWGSIAR